MVNAPLLALIATLCSTNGNSGFHGDMKDVQKLQGTCFREVLECLPDHGITLKHITNCVPHVTKVKYER